MTSWEDVIFTAGQVCFGASLLGMLRSAHKPPAWSAAMYALWVWAFTAADINLGLPLATVTAAINAAMWTWLAWQAWHTRYVLRRRIIRALEDDDGMYRKSPSFTDFVRETELRATPAERYALDVARARYAHDLGRDVRY